VLLKKACPTLYPPDVALFDPGFERKVVMKLLTLSNPPVVIFTLDTISVLAQVIVVFAFNETRALNTVLDGTAPKKFLTVIFFDTGVPFGSSTIRSKSSREVLPSDVSCETFLSAICFLLLYDLAAGKGGAHSKCAEVI
jgi:hypothetical protein